MRVETDAMIEMKIIYPKFQQKLVERPSEHWLKEFLGKWKLKTLKSTDIELLRSKQATASAIKNGFLKFMKKLISIYMKRTSLEIWMKQ